MSRTRNFFRAMFTPARQAPIALNRLRRKLSLHSLEARELPAIFNVTNLADSGAGSLRQAVIGANGASGLDDINFTVAPGPITLASEIAITDSVNINAFGHIVSGNNATRLFNTSAAPSGSTVSFSRLILTGGKCTSYGGDGGAVVAIDQVLNFTDCVITGNESAFGDGGAIAFEKSSVARLNLVRCTVAGNKAHSGGAIAFTNGGGFTIDNSTISGNTGSSGYEGGGLYFEGAAATAVIRNSTFANNSANAGGAIGFELFHGNLVAQNTTIVGNTSSYGGGGISSANSFGSNIITLESTIVAGNVDLVNHYDDFYVTGTVNANFSAIGTKTAVAKFNGDATTIALLGQNFKLGALANNGGPTQTIRPAIDSPVVDAGSNPASLTTDQRGQTRVAGSAPDIGAVEFANTSIVTNDNDSGVGSLRQAVLETNNDPGPGVVTFDAAAFALTDKTITLTSGEIAITDDLVISGPGAAEATVSGNNFTRIFNTQAAPSGTHFTVTGMTLTAGHDTDKSGGTVAADDQLLNFTDCVVTGNYSSDGAIAFASTSVGRLNLLRCSVIGTIATNGGAIAFAGGGGFTIDDSTISGNKSNGTGGGGLVFTGAAASAVIRNSTFANNTAQNGGAIQLKYFTGTLLVQNTTISGNTATLLYAGGIDRVNGTGIISLDSSIVAGNFATGGANDDLFSNGTVNANFSAIGTKTGVTTFNGDATTTALLGQNLKLEALANNGGPTQTILPAADSPVLDRGSNPAGLTTDQRGLPRTLNAQADIGAVEVVNLVVRNDADAGKDSLRQQVLDANALVGVNAITFDAAAFALTDKTITLTSDEIAVTDELVITGPGATAASISGGGTSRIFNTSAAPSGTIVTVTGLTLTGGSSISNGGAVAAVDQVLNFTDCVITGNNGREGGAIRFDTTSVGRLNLLRCSVTGNSATMFSGGAIYFFDGGGFTIDNSTISGNSTKSASFGEGGGLGFYGSAATAVIRNSTFANNSARSGGAIQLRHFSGTLVVQNTTISGNTATGGDAGGINRYNGTGVISLDSSIVAANVATANANDDLFTTGTVNANFSAIGTKTGVNTFNGDATTNALLGQNLKLGTLANNGGPTPTILPAADSPVRDNGNNPTGLTTDQRGLPRIWNVQPDIGSVELDPNFIVRNDADAGKDSLRQQVLDANAFAGANTITFDSAAFALTDKTITLTSGEIAVTDALVVAGPGAAAATVSGGGTSRIFNTSFSPSGATITVTGMTLTGGKSTASGGAVFATGQVLNFTDCVITANQSPTNGGAIFLSGPTARLNLLRCTVIDNLATGVSSNGGAIYFNNGGGFTIDDSTIAGNQAIGGGGLFFFGNPPATAVIRNSTFANNSAASGGAILFNAFSGTLLVQNTTITGNTATTGSGGGINRTSGAGVISLDSTIVAGNFATANANDDLFTTGTVNANFSAIGTQSGVTTFNADATTTALLGQNLKLGVLADNGGPTQTVRPAFNSPVVNKGSNPAGLTTDQRGKARVVGSIDIGAFEVQPGTKVTSVVIGDGTPQRSIVKQLKVIFDSPVTFVGMPDAAFTLTRQNDSKAVNLAVAMDPTNTIATLTFTGGAVDNKSLADGRYTLNVLANQFGADGLDGDGNGTSGDDYSLAGSPVNGLFRLFGDSDGNGTINAADFLAFRSAFGGTSVAFDFNGNGSVDASDFLQFRQRFGGSI